MFKSVASRPQMSSATQGGDPGSGSGNFTDKSDVLLQQDMFASSPVVQTWNAESFADCSAQWPELQSLLPLEDTDFLLLRKARLLPTELKGLLRWSRQSNGLGPCDILGVPVDLPVNQARPILLVPSAFESSLSGSAKITSIAPKDNDFAVMP